MAGKYASPASRSRSDTSSSSRSPLERKQSLRSALDRTKNLHSDGASMVKHLEDIVREADSINLEATIDEKVTSHDEVLMDAAVMSSTSKVLKSSACLITKEMSSYNVTMFAEKLLQQVHTDPDETLDKPNWLILESMVVKMFKKTPNYTALYGCLSPFEIPQKVIVKRQPVKREALAAVKRPDAIVEVGNDDDSVEETVSKIRRLISQHHKDTGSPVEFYRLVLHPENFGKTIENMLHVSFLVRDGLLQMKLDDDGNPVIVPSTKEMKSQAKKSGKKGNTQNVFALNFQQWKTLVTQLKVTEPMINFQ